jgi:hypothetical protein
MVVAVNWSVCEIVSHFRLRSFDLSVGCRFAINQKASRYFIPFCTVQPLTFLSIFSANSRRARSPETQALLGRL